jgi:hypothetical protein
MQLEKNGLVELRSKINIECLENESTKLLIQNKFLEKINGNGIEERDEKAYLVMEISKISI